MGRAVPLPKAAFFQWVDSAPTLGAFEAELHREGRANHVKTAGVGWGWGWGMGWVGGWGGWVGGCVIHGEETACAKA